MRRIGWRLRRKYRLRQQADEQLRLDSATKPSAVKNPSIERVRLAAEAYIRRLDSVAKK